MMRREKRTRQKQKKTKREERTEGRAPYDTEGNWQERARAFFLLLFLPLQFNNYSEDALGTFLWPQPSHQGLIPLPKHRNYPNRQAARCFSTRGSGLVKAQANEPTHTPVPDSSSCPALPWHKSAQPTRALLGGFLLSSPTDQPQPGHARRDQSIPPLAVSPTWPVSSDSTSTTVPAPS